MISPNELTILSYYRAGELAGSLLFGRLALHTDIDSIRIPLTRHCLEEAEHAYLWTKTIKELGAIPLKVTTVYQTEYGKEFGLPQNMLEIFCLTQTLEKRVLAHFQQHLARPDTQPAIRKALEKMIEDESGHLNWIKVELDKYANEHGQASVDQTMARLREVDEKVYRRIASQSPYREYFGDKL